MKSGVKFGVVVFPGSNCDYDVYDVLKRVMKQKTVFLWHKEHDLQDCDVIVLPGGFSYGDYLRTGAMARYSPIMQEVINFAKNGGIVLGICNGFQVLLETNLLPGAMLKNKTLRLFANRSTCELKTITLSLPVAVAKGKY